ncbi:MAG TPA: SDR family NAD(P)-dependent oxidoreductase [Gammaproteobacteria bacterium]|jgi:NAD(P)-dependent dehydrogenase (short-subunit alcohol dehydrogenase family)|nr:SDR family NAD(P)-dependent oxidoreductase [Gammaproteobacteria bacterium]
MSEVVLIVGAGEGLSASLARRFARDGARIVLAARVPERLHDVAAATHAEVVRCDAVVRADVEALFAACDAGPGSPDVVVYNPGARLRGPLVELDPEAVRTVLEVSAYGGFLVAQAAAKRMLRKGHGTILFTGASASVKGYAQSAPFAMGKFALRGLAQSLARELQPQNIHVAHFVIDGGIRSAARQVPAESPDSLLDPDAIADTYFHVARQPRSAWTWEVELRPWVEKF